MSNILLLDRNIDEAERISSYFEARSYAVIWPKTIADLLYHVVHRDFCLAILDVALSAEDDHRFLDQSFFHSVSSFLVMLPVQEQVRIAHFLSSFR